ncbi:MAG: ABC transporter permease [Bryobacteraceae bacterium]|nr:ABC transporter permease [Bryobacteraceae bacterium]
MSTPVLYLWAIRLIGWMVPAPRRKPWRQQWENGASHWWAFLIERGEPADSAARKLWQYVRGAWQDAVKQRFPNEDWKKDLRFLTGSPLFLFGAAGAFVLLLALMTDMFAGARVTFGPLPFPAAERLYDVKQDVATLGQLSGVPPQTVRMWQQCTPPEVEQLAAYRFHAVELGRDGATEETITAVSVTPEFFELLAVAQLLGRGFRREDLQKPHAVVLGEDLWESRFARQENVLGRIVTLDGQPAQVIGVMPRRFWFLSKRADLWTLFPPIILDDNVPRERRLRYLGAVVRLADGKAPAQAQESLRAIARGNRYPWGGRELRLQSLSETTGGPSPYMGAAGLAVAFLLVVASTLIPAERFSVRSIAGLPFAKHSRYWWFLIAKTATLLGALTLLWVELVHGPRPPVFGLAMSWLFLLACVGVAAFCIRDQRRRCPVCLHRLALPISIGTWANTFEPAKTELLCEQGHGTLLLPETEISAAPKERWTALDDSWRELFTR